MSASRDLKVLLGKRIAQEVIRFRDGTIGIEYIGNQVMKVREKSQASRKGVKVGWLVVDTRIPTNTIANLVMCSDAVWNIYRSRSQV